MLKTSVIDELTHYGGRILLVQGTLDKAVHPDSAKIAYTTLLSKGKAVELLLVDNADHSFNLLATPEVDGWTQTIGRVYEWFNQEGAPTQK
jgi:dipeptidyl aminopeptidase/acylaminoacyl peptidase